MLNKIRAIIESGAFSFLLFWIFVAVYHWLSPPGEKVAPSMGAVALISIVHYLTAIFCGYWAGWRAKTDGWIYGIIGYTLFKGMTSLFGVHAVLPFPLHIKLLGYIPILTLLMFGGVIGEQRAHYEPVSKQHGAIYPIIKRAADMTVSVISLLLLGPIMLGIAFGIKSTSPGPIFFHQKRLGQHGRVVNLIKFRTMSQDADELVDRLEVLQNQDDQSCQIKDDPRIFPFGKFLRTTSLDEVPQLINVFIGEMSLVGPRPLVPEEIDKSDTQALKRLEVKPGLTGLAQINGRGNLTPQERLQMDIHYVENHCMLLDLKILLSTIYQVLMRRGAY